jgi:hypothetical protein
MKLGHPLTNGRPYGHLPDTTPQHRHHDEDGKKSCCASICTAWLGCARLSATTALGLRRVLNKAFPPPVHELTAGRLFALHMQVLCIARRL